MRRSTFNPLNNSNTQEPLIVVEETHCTERNDNEVHRATAISSGDSNSGQMKMNKTTSANNNNNNNNTNNNNNNNNNDNDNGGLGDGDSPKNPYLLCPFPDVQQRRKHSLPSLQITEGMMASQVRRLSDAGGESGSISPHDVEFLTTLTTQKSNSTGSGRRHSVITISAIQSSPLFGRNRRESIAGVSCSRRGSGFQGPPLTDHRGSIHNLQLDIMDGIVQTRKGRTSIWTAPILKETESNVPLQA